MLWLGGGSCTPHSCFVALTSLGVSLAFRASDRWHLSVLLMASFKQLCGFLAEGRGVGCVWWFWREGRQHTQLRGLLAEGEQSCVMWLWCVVYHTGTMCCGSYQFGQVLGVFLRLTQLRGLLAEFLVQFLSQGRGCTVVCCVLGWGLYTLSFLTSLGRSLASFCASLSCVVFSLSSRCSSLRFSSFSTRSSSCSWILICE